MKHKSLTIVICAVLLNGCTAVAERNPYDPYEPYNRTMFKINDKADQYVLKPVAKGYRKVTPKPVQTAVGNFFNNLRDVVSFGSNMLRGEVGKAGYDFMRVAVNTTFGLGGLINIADEAGMPSHKNTLGDTFATWGWKKSNYFVYPLLGPSTVRDSVAGTLVSVYPVESAIIPKPIGRFSATVLKAVDQRAQYLELTERLDQMAMDKYAYTRDMYMAIRNKQVGNEVAPENEINVDDLVENNAESSNTLPENKIDPKNQKTEPQTKPIIIPNPTPQPVSKTSSQNEPQMETNTIQVELGQMQNIHPEAQMAQIGGDLIEQDVLQYQPIASQIWQYQSKQ